MLHQLLNEFEFGEFAYNLLHFFHVFCDVCGLYRVLNNAQIKYCGAKVAGNLMDVTRQRKQEIITTFRDQKILFPVVQHGNNPFKRFDVSSSRFTNPEGKLSRISTVP